jgi:hypothetical protein
MEFVTREEVHNFFNLYYILGFSLSYASSYRIASKKRNDEVKVYYEVQQIWQKH